MKKTLVFLSLCLTSLAIQANMTNESNTAITGSPRINAVESVDEDYTSYITNPSFENDLSSEWAVSSMSRQNNNVFTRKVGTYYLESWVGIGSQLGSFGVSQSITLPTGNYQLKANALHIQQSGSGSTTNSGSAQTGAYLFAGNSRKTITSMATYSLTFSVFDSQSSIEIGVKGEGATGNWICVDNFQLEYTGALTLDSYKSELQNLIDIGEDYLDKGIQNSVKTNLQSAVNTANNAMSSSSQSTVTSAISTLTSAIESAETSYQLYAKLISRIEYAQKVLNWWEGVSYRSTAWSQLQTSVNTATAQSTNYDLTTAQLNSATNTLNTRIKAVDKSIYCSGSACGSDSELQNSNNNWCYDRSFQSKHWILFWEPGYGTDVPSAVPEILDNADRIFEYYANTLKYVRTNEGKSKTDTYKMIIRLRYTDEWEASGSGIDNMIGLLTLSRWAYTSRGGQTVAHEIGHCFQYQTHCDNGDWNGWMYNWGNSTLNVFWEMCAQWQAYKFYPSMQFDNEWFYATINGLHRHPLCVDLRYNNYFIQDYFCHKHGIDFLGRMWNESISPEDPLQAYMRMTMSPNNAKNLAQLSDEMWEYGARMTTFDMDPIRSTGAYRIGYRNQTDLTKDSENYWWPTQGNCIENFGNNAIRLNAPSSATTIYVQFEGKAGADGYNSYNVNKAGWRIGFVAYKSNGTRVYSDITTANYSHPNKTIAFDCPAGCSYVWLVVSGAPTNYWTRDWLSWSEESTVEQWPYRVKFYKTNVYGQSNNNSTPTIPEDDPEYSDQHVAGGKTYYDITNAMAPWLSTNAFNDYTNNGFSVATWGSYIGVDGSDVSVPFFEKWVSSSSGTLANASLQQTISELPNGTYYIGGSFIATNQGNSGTDVTGVTFWAGDQSVTLATGDGEPELYSLQVEVTDHTLTFGVRTQSTTANWVAMDNFFLYWAGTEYSYYNQATATSPVRVVIGNPRMDDGKDKFFPEWKLVSDGNGKWQPQGASYANFSGKFMETWTGSENTLGDKTALQTLSLIGGKYVLKAAVNAVRQNNASLAVSGVTLHFGDQSVDCHTGDGAPEIYTITSTLEQGDYELGLKIENTNANWVAWDNLKLYYYKDDGNAYYLALNECQQVAANNEANNAGAAMAALADFEWTDAEYATKTEDEINKAIEVLNNGIVISNASQVATSLIKNVDFTGGYTGNANGSRVQTPNEWTFDYTYSGWNDTYVDATNHLFNAWAGGITRAELSQAISNLPNGTYRLSADVRVDKEAKNTSTALYGFGEGGDVARSQEAGTEFSGSTTDFYNYSCAFEVTNNEATIGIISNNGFYQIKDIKLEYITGTEAQRETDASYLRQDYFWLYSNNDEVDLKTSDATAKYGKARGVVLYPKFPNQIIYSLNAIQISSTMDNVVKNGNCAKLVITDGEHLTITKPFTATAATYTRSIGETAEWGTICLPYSLTSDENIQFFKLVSVNGAWMNFEPISNVDANTPVIFRKLTENATTITCSGSGSVVTTASQQGGGASENDGWWLEGVYAETQLEDSQIDGTVYYVAQNKFWKAETVPGMKIPAFRAYIHGLSGLNSKCFNINVVDPATGIRTIDESGVEISDGLWYTIDGRILNNRPSEPGIYIHGGQKVVIGL